MNPRRAAASLILVIALFAGSIAYTTFIVRRVTNEPETVADAAGEVVSQPVIRDQMIDEIAAEILAYVGPGFAEAATAAGFDPVGEARAIAEDTVATPEYEEAIRQTLIDLHEMTFVGPPGKLVIDIAGVTEAARVAAIARNPLYGPMFPADAELIVRSPIDKVPDLSALKDRVNDAFGTGLFVALIGIAAAFAIHDRRHVVLRRLGSWAMLLAAGHLFVSWVLPGIADIYVDEHDDVPIAETLVKTVGTFVRTPAIVMFITGIGLVAVSFAWQATSRSRRFVLSGSPSGAVVPPAPPPPLSTPPQGYPAAPPPVTEGYPVSPPTAPPVTRGYPAAPPPPAPNADDPPEGDSVFSDWRRPAPVGVTLEHRVDLRAPPVGHHQRLTRSRCRRPRSQILADRRAVLARRPRHPCRFSMIVNVSFQ